MRIALINQAFYPDVVSSGQHLTDLALNLAARGHDVTVVTGRRGYDEPGRKFPRHETWRGIRIYRVLNTGLGRETKWRRAVDFASFMWSCCWRLCLLPRKDLIVGMTSPPLVSFFAAWFARVRRAKFVYWVMDLNPDEALAAGWLTPGSFWAEWLERFSRFSLQRAAKVIVLDRFMQERIRKKGILTENIEVIPPWSHDSEVHFDVEGRAEFRKAHGLEDKFVVMYSGNHSRCHPLDTVVGAARRLAGNKEIAFCFIGGGTEFRRVKRAAQEQRLVDVVCVPYQPLDRLAGALSAADLHLVVMGDAFVGLVHPCKIYNILRVGSPVLYVGPEPSHVSELFDRLNGHPPFEAIRHGDVEGVVCGILKMKDRSVRSARGNSAVCSELFARESLLPRLVGVLECAADERESPSPTLWRRRGNDRSLGCGP